MKLKIRHKIHLVTLPSFLSLIFIFLIQQNSLEVNLAQSDWVLNVQNPIEASLFNLKTAFSEEMNAINRLAFNTIGPEEVDAIHEVSKKVINFNIEAILKHSEAIDKSMVDNLIDLLESRNIALKEIIDASIANNLAKTRMASAKYILLGEKINIQIEIFHGKFIENQNRAMNENMLMQKQNLNKSTLLFLLSVIISFLLSAIITFYLENPIKHLETIFQNVRTGNLSVRAQVETNDELQTLGASFNHMLESIIEAQKQLSRSAKLTTMGELAGSIAHEINNPLTVVLLTVQKLQIQKEKDQLTPEILDQALEKIEHTTKRITKIIKGLKGLSRNSENDPMELVILEALFEDCATLVKDKYQRNHTKLRVSCDPTLKVLGRPSQLFQVVVNLLNNSHDAISKLENRWVELEAKISPDDPDRVLIRVTDSGSGIPEDIQANLMKPFFTTKPTGQGTGLGLSISSKIAEAHGGTLYYDKNHSQCSFILELPCVEFNPLKKTA